METEKIKERHISRIAYVYIRQSTQYQAEHNTESQMRQYKLAEKAKAVGFKDVRIIDEDLGISAGGYSERSGFKKLVAEVSLNKVGIIFGLEVSRFARNNRDWYHLIDLCALFDTLIADQDGVYHPGHPNDRMLLGLKGTMSEVEINIMKGRMLEGARNKAKRGELIYRLPIGYIKTEDNKIEKDPNQRIQKIIEQVFAKFRETCSARQTALWFVQEKISFPTVEFGRFGRQIVWKSPVYGTIWNVMKNPTYAGAYAYGMRQSKKYLDGEQIKKTRVQVPIKEWKVLIKENHAGYITWEEYEKNQAIMQENDKKIFGGSRGPILEGPSLLAGLIRCKRCGRKLRVGYSGKSGKVPHYNCSSGRLQKGEKECIAFGGMRVDETVSKEVLKVVKPLSIEASMKAIEEFNKDIDGRRKMLLLELETAEYEAERAFRQYNNVDPGNRLVSAQLESKWNSCLLDVERVKERVEGLSKEIQPLNEQEKQKIIRLSKELPEFWDSPTTTSRMRKKLMRAVIEELIADIDVDRSVVLLDIHWVGGVHTRLEVKKNKTGEHTRSTDKDIVELVKQLARQLPDQAISPILNRLGKKTGAGNNWTRDRIRFLRNYNNIPAYNGQKDCAIITLQEAADKLGICAQSVRGLIKRQIITAQQVAPCAPWAISKEELEKEEVREAVEEIKEGANRHRPPSEYKRQLSLFK